MQDLFPHSVRGLFLKNYEVFRQRLRRRLGSDELAVDALQETWFRVERMAGTGPERNPVAYLFRMALNIASDQRMAQSRLLTGIEIGELLDESSEAMDPAIVVNGQVEVEALARALEELPLRQRTILISARLENLMLTEIAAQHGISVRMVGKELKAALQHCGKRLDRKVVQRFGPGAGTES